ncbi:MAG: ABC transporter ATP-binding protein [Lachnospiraceae bacterium]|jgi:ATP-binding cassette subfamily B multidrug efflux pump|nr:ABC transporter ATP-binding protein [Lachnospiraceae bacterium]
MNQIKWAFSFLGKSKYKLFTAWALALLFNLLTVVDPTIVSKIVDDILYPMFEDASITTETVMGQLLPLALLAFGLIVLRSTLRFIANIFREQASQRATFEIRRALYKKLGEQSRSFFMSNRSGDLINKCTGDVEAINHFVCWVAFSIFESFVMLIVVLIVFFSISWKFTLIELCLAPVALLTAIKLGKTVRPIFGAARQQLSKLNTVVQENISGNRVVRAFCREKFEIEKFDTENEKYYDMNLTANKAWVTYSPIMETVGNIMNACAIIIGALLVITGDISVGNLVIFTSLSWMLNEPMQQLGFLINDTQRFLVSCERVHELYDSTPEILSPDQPVSAQNIRGDIDLEHVSLTFDGNTVLKDINMHIPAGSVVGIMGPTGSGKSSVLNLITRFVDPNKGHVKLDGVDVSRYNLQDLRRSIGIALQDVFLFSDTVESNIAYGVPDAPNEVVYRSAEDADADSFVTRLPDGYDTIVGERGMGLSGGQKQRLALARALAMESPVLILDDTTSAVDLETEQYIQQRLAQRPVKATTLIVAQRISSVKNADIIFIIEDGKITEQGTHKELLEKQGYYYNIYRIQQGYATAADLSLGGEA